MLGRLSRDLRIGWVGWLRFEYRALAILLPIVCFEMTEASVLVAHLPAYVGIVGALPALLARDAWGLAAQIRPVGQLAPC